MKHVLIVEDDRSIRETLKDILELSGYHVSTARNGKEGLQAILDKRPEIVLCDVCMPELDGFGLLRKVKSMFVYDRPHFVFITAKVEKDEIRKGMRLGAAAYIRKPFDHKALLGTLSKLKARSKQTKPNRYGVKSELKRINPAQVA